jgi:DNA-binding transcriptional MocR family regulator
VVLVPDAMSTGRLATLLGPWLGRTPAYLGLAGGLRTLISDGRITVGSRLPSERELTRHLAVSRTTVTRAYDVLREQDYLESRQGSGSVARLPMARSGRIDHLLMPRGSDESSIDLTIAAPAAPPGVTEAYAAALTKLPGYLSGSGYYPSGVPALREAIAQRYAGRGLATTPEQVLIVSGALSGLAIAAQALVSPGDRVLVEVPTYPNPIMTLQARGARLVGTSVDAVHGWDVEGALGVLRSRRPTAGYLIPDFHNPTGALMPEDVRASLGEAFRASGMTPVVDESMVELGLEEEHQRAMPAPFASFSPDTVTVGSASKAFWVGLRIGWIRVPRERVGALTAARLSLDLASPLLEQLTMLEMLADDTAILTHHRSTLAASRAALLAALAEHLPDWTVRPGPGGLAVWCQLPRPASSALSITAERHGVYLAAGPSFAPKGGLEHHVRLPYALPPQTLVEAVRRLALAWAQTPEEPWTTPGRAPVVA